MESISIEKVREIAPEAEAILLEPGRKYLVFYDRRKVSRDDAKRVGAFLKESGIKAMVIGNVGDNAFSIYEVK